jgi:hypothetical protein
LVFEPATAKDESLARTVNKRNSITVAVDTILYGLIGASQVFRITNPVLR